MRKSFATRSLAISALSASLLACNASAQSDPELAWEWKDAPERSSVYFSQSGTGLMTVSLFRRCWQRSGIYDCLNVTGTGQYYQANRYEMSHLNKSYSDDAANASLEGYSCAFFPETGLVEERLAGTGDFIARNSVNLFTAEGSVKPWTRDYAEHFLTAKGIKRTGTHFDCAELAGVVASSGMNALVANTISYNQLMK